MHSHTPFRAPRRMALACFAVAVVTATTGCGAGEKNNASAGGAPASQPASHNQAVETSTRNLSKYAQKTTAFPTVKPIGGGIDSLKGKTVWYVPFGSGVPILNAYGVTTGQALAKAGLNFHQCDGKFVPTTIASCLSQAGSQGANAVITGYVDYELVPTAFDALVAAGIPVLLAGVEPSGSKTSTPKFAILPLTENNKLMQTLSADAVIADSGGKAHILYVGSTDSTATRLLAATAKDHIAEACPGCTFTNLTYTTAALDKLPSQVSSALVAHPDTTYVVPTFDSTVPQVIAGIRSAGFADKVKVASRSASLDGLQRIKNGQIQFADVGSSPAYTGWQFADSIMRQMTGNVPDESNPGVVRVFNKDNVGELDLTPNAYGTNDWYGSDEYQQTFLTAWSGK